MLGAKVVLMRLPPHQQQTRKERRVGPAAASRGSFDIARGEEDWDAVQRRRSREEDALDDVVQRQIASGARPLRVRPALCCFSSHTVVNSQQSYCSRAEKLSCTPQRPPLQRDAILTQPARLSRLRALLVLWSQLNMWRLTVRQCSSSAATPGREIACPPWLLEAPAFNLKHFPRRSLFRRRTSALYLSRNAVISARRRP